MIMRNFHPSIGIEAYEGSVFQITHGLCGRTNDGEVFAKFETFAPNEALQAANEKLGFVRVDAVSRDRTISADENRPTQFSFTKEHTIPAGEPLAIPGLPPTRSPFKLNITTSFLASTWLDGAVLRGTFDATWLVDVHAQQVRVTGSGEVQIEVRPRIGPQLAPRLPPR
jgi:hypothetical protein